MPLLLDPSICGLTWAHPLRSLPSFLHSLRSFLFTMALRRLLSSLFIAASYAGIQAQTAANYTDPATGIKFLQVTQEGGHAFGVALPEVGGSDFIGQLSAPLPEGWAGCILGGGTTVNGLAFIRPPSFAFDDKWPLGWKWSDVEASAERFYDRNPGTLLPSADGHYYDYAVYDVLSRNLAAAGRNSTDTSANPDDKSKIFSFVAVNVLAGKRAGPVATYLPLMQNQSTFKLMLNTLVLRAVRTNSTITGVEAQLQDGSRMIINVNQGGKVILAAGAMSSSRILFRSGIGPSDQINVVKSGSTPIAFPDENAWIESPVGFVKDHTTLAVTFTVKPGMTIMGEPDYTNPKSSIMRLNTFQTVTTSDNHKLIVQTHNWATENTTITTLFLLTQGTTSNGTLGLTVDGNTVWTQSPYLQTATDREVLAIAVDTWLAMSCLPNSTIEYVVDAGMHADLPTGNTQAIVGVAAEHAVQKILALDTGVAGGNATSSASVSVEAGSATSTAIGVATGMPLSSDSLSWIATSPSSLAAITSTVATRTGRVPYGPTASFS
ncbi:hypothetical protein BDV96DRAFT_627478 [Lophiotrema nucula]|uniref:Glucose-methanol-choline oxidoreductase N-terminal domain-containing protein n=1 Tax=Lophiotrema nucula TaxID=690887 RepID=A0A6A5ZT44_9PLEO|nr:hypothetical protein BDV96DRAFT_627478 [Lophiotrema nucula]